MKLRALEEVQAETLEAAVGGFDAGLRQQGYSLYQMQGDMRKYCRPQGRGRGCIYGVVRNNEWRQGIGEEDFRRNEHEPLLRHQPGASWGDPIPLK